MGLKAMTRMQQKTISSSSSYADILQRIEAAMDAARAVLTAGRYAVIEVHRWQFGGRAS